MSDLIANVSINNAVNFASQSLVAETASFAFFAATSSYFLESGSISSAAFATNAEFAATASVALVAESVDYSNITSLPTILSSSLQINTGSFTGSFFGDGSKLRGVITSSFSTTSSNANTVDFYNNIVNKPSLISSSTQLNTGSFTGSFVGNGAGIFSVQGAVSSSYALSVPFGNLTALPMLVSASSQISYGGLTNIPVGIVTASQQISYPSISNITPGLVSSSVQVNTGSFSGSITSASYALFAQNAQSASYALTASSAIADWNSINNKPGGIVSSSTQVVSSSYAVTSSFASTLDPRFQVVTASFALTAGTTGGGLTGGGTPGKHSKFTNVSVLGDSIVSEVNSQLEVSGSLGVTGSVTANSFTGNGAGVIGIISSSYTVTASNASSVQFGNVTALPTLVSSSAQVNTGSFTGSFNGAFTGIGAGVTGIVSSSYTVTASNASSVQFTNVTALPTLVSSSGQISYPALSNIPVGIVSSSTQINTGSFTGSFVGTHTGIGAGLTGVISSSYAITASNASSVQFGNVSALPTLVSNSAQISYPVIANIPVGIVSSSTQINTGSFTGSFIGNGASITGVISSSYAVTSSAATSLTFIPATASFALTAGNAMGTITGTGSAGMHAKFTGASSIGNSAISEIGNKVEVSASVDVTGSVNATSLTGNGAGITGVISSSYAITSSFASSIPFGNVTALPTLVSNSAQISYPVIANIPAGIVSSSIQVNTGSFTGSFNGTFNGNGANVTGVVSSSYAVTSSAATSITFIPVTASYALTAGATGGGLVGGGTTGFYSKFTNGSTLGNALVSEVGNRVEVSGSTDISGSLNVSANITANAFSGIGTNVTGVVSSSYTVTASFATTASAATSITFVPATASFATTASAATSITFVPATASFATTASFAANASSIPFTSITGLPTLVSSSTQINTGSFTGSFVGNGVGVTGIVSSSYALTASFALNGGNGGVSSSYAITSSFASAAPYSGLSGLPTLVSSSTQVSTGSFTGSFIGNGAAITGIVSSSFATTASAATSITFIPATASFANTSSAATSITFTPATASYALTAGATGGGLVGGGTAGFHAKFTGPSSVGNGITSEVNNRLEVSGSIDVTGSIVANGFSGGGAGILGVVSSSYSVSSSLAAFALTSSYFSGSAVFPAGLSVTGPVSASTGFKGDGSNITGVISSSYALTASFALNGGGGGGSSVSSSFATTASAATSITFIPATASFALTAGATGGGIAGTGVAGAYAKFTNASTVTSAIVSEVNSRVEVSGSMDVTGSISSTGGFLGTASFATTASLATNAVSASYITGSIDFNNGLVVTGSVTATAGFIGDGSQVTGVVSSSYALTASFALNGGTGGSSTSASYATTASFATLAATGSYFSGSAGFPNGLMVTGSVTSSVAILTSASYGPSYGQTSSSLSPVTSFIDTGLFLNNIGFGGAFETVTMFNPFSGSTNHRTLHHGYFYVSTNEIGGNELSTVSYTEIARAASGSDFASSSLSVVFVSASIESQTATPNSSAYQIRIKYTNVNTTNVAQNTRIKRIM